MKALFVDDENLILQGLRRSLYDVDDTWEILFAQGGSQALSILEEQSVDVVVTDMRMPVMGGIALLELVKEKRPEAVRVVLSGETDEESTSRAVAIAHQFLSKPFEPARLLQLVKQTDELNQLLQSQELRRTLQDLKALPPVPRIYQELTSALTNPKTDARAVSRIVQRDPALCAKLLQLVNSSFFARRIETTDVAAATIHLGMNTIRNLVLGLELFDPSSGLGQAMGNEAEEMQDNALGMAMACELVAEGTPWARDAFVLGLFLDLGQLAIAATDRKRWTACRDHANRTGVPLVEAERAEFGVSHAEAGAYLLGIWGLPYYIVEAVACHHRPDQGKSPGLSPPSIAALAVSLIDQCPMDDDWLDTVGVRASIPRWREALGR